MIHDTTEYEKAKAEDEPLFIQCARCSGFSSICSTTDDQDMMLHADAIGIFQNKLVMVDVKHVSQKNLQSGKYSISSSLKSFIESNELDKNHMLAFRVSRGNTLSDEFICAYTHEVFTKCMLEEKHSPNGSTYWLVKLDDVKASCNCIQCKLDYVP